ncbi:unnamed protein product [Didymodactylos carnosus]|uniref:Uncharacterized protein n=1 Tax=Didymodactylos carnosus TaxID=1234261 RepID=A0A8S2L3P8_9BILA|nr:unnamed protein product [Didymodactylos carnosus]CAF3878389.1 unnamed protein product [Didymodactylos carnosus]
MYQRISDLCEKHQVPPPPLRTLTDLLHLYESKIPKKTTTHGAYFHVKHAIVLLTSSNIELVRELRRSGISTLRFRLCQDGTWIGKNLNCFASSLGWVDAGSKTQNALSLAPLAFVKIPKDDRVNLQEYMTDEFIQMFAPNQTMTIDGSQFNIKFTYSADYKMVYQVMGLAGVASAHQCNWCKYQKMTLANIGPSEKKNDDEDGNDYTIKRQPSKKRIRKLYDFHMGFNKNLSLNSSSPPSQKECQFAENLYETIKSVKNSTTYRYEEETTLDVHDDPFDYSTSSDEEEGHHDNHSESEGEVDGEESKSEKEKRQTIEVATNIFGKAKAMARAQRALTDAQKEHVDAADCYLNEVRQQTTSYDPLGFDADGFDKSGFNRDGYNSDGFHRTGYNAGGFNTLGFDRQGYDIDGFNADGYNQIGLDKQGYNQDGFNSFGMDRSGFNVIGLNKDGYNRAGYNLKGFNDMGYDRDGFDEHDFNIEGIRRFDTDQQLEDMETDSDISRMG